MVKVYAVKMEGALSEQSIYAMLHKNLNINKVLEKRLFKEQYLALLSQCIVRYMLVKEFGEEEYVLRINSFGKPYVLHYSGDYNISSCKEWVVGALQPEGVIGIDIEQVAPIDLQIVNTICTEREIKSIQGAKDSYESFYKYWTLKEAYVKMLGTGLYTSLLDIELDVQELIRYKEKYDRKLCFQQYELDGNYICSVCTNGNDLSEQIEVIKEQELFQFVCMYNRA